MVGVALVGHCLSAMQTVLGRFEAPPPIKSGVPCGNIARGNAGLLMQPNSDFNAIENYRSDAFCKQALGIALSPSSPTLRQRMGALPAERFDVAAAMMETLPGGRRPQCGVLPGRWLALDVDTFGTQGYNITSPCGDNCGTTKEGVDRTHAGVAGDCPLAA